MKTSDESDICQLRVFADDSTTYLFSGFHLGMEPLLEFLVKGGHFLDGTFLRSDSRDFVLQPLRLLS